jgi:hypothetical protein
MATTAPGGGPLPAADAMEVDPPRASADEKHVATVMGGNDAVTGHIISTTIGGKNGEPKRTISYMAEGVVGIGSFGVVFQVRDSLLVILFFPIWHFSLTLTHLFMVCGCVHGFRQNALRLAKLLPLRRFYRIKDTRIGSCR